MTRRQIIAAIVAAVGVLYGLVALWWWALWGMSQNVALANGLTAFGLIFVGAMWSFVLASP